MYRWILLLALAAVGCASVPAPAPIHAPRALPLAALDKTTGPVVALVLGGGGARGFAHIGAIEALEREGIRPDLVVGTSAGSLVGALYAGGIRGEALVRVAQSVQRSELVDFVFPNRGFIEGERLQEYVDAALAGRLIEGLDLPFVAVATDLRAGHLVAFNAGDVGAAVRASCSVPAIFQPTQIEGREYVDGGLTSPVPVRVARKLGAEIVIAVDVSRQPAEQRDLGSTTAILSHSFVIMEHALATEESALADVVIRPSLASVKATDLAARDQAIREGQAAANAAIPAIRRLLAEGSGRKTR